MTLDKKDFQDFMKRLRKIEWESNKANPVLTDYSADIRLKYYLAGEYGSRRERPHYHMIIFNVMDIESFNKAWGKGSVYIGLVEGASINYTLKYINKGKIIPKHANDDRIPEFSLMSKKMGLNYLTPQVVEYHKTGQKTYLTLEGGVKVSMPRYYREKIWTEQERLKIAQLMAKMAEKKIELGLKEYVKLYGTTQGYEKWKENGALVRLERHREKGLKDRNE